MKRTTLFLLLFLASCSMFGSRASVLDNPTCELPCWNNIIPGVTTYTDALQIIPAIKEIDSNSVEPLGAPWNQYSQQILFHLYPELSNAKVQTDGHLDFMESKVAALTLRRNIHKTFEEMFEITGEPELVIPIPFPQGPSVMAISPSKGVVYNFLARSGNLKPDTEIETVILFDPKRYQELLNAGLFSWGEWSGEDTLKMAYPWKGYGYVEDLYPIRYP